MSILSQLLGAPLYARWDTPESFQFTPADCAPLEAWLNDHPLPPKVKNQGKAELIQEIPDLCLDGGPVILFRPLAYADNRDAAVFGCKIGDVIGQHRYGGFWGQQNADGTLALIPLEEDSILPILSPDDHAPTGTLEYAELGGRLVTYGDKLAPHPSFSGAFVPSQCVILADTAGLCPTPLALTLDGEPVQGKLHLLPGRRTAGGTSGRAGLRDHAAQSSSFRRPALLCSGRERPLAAPRFGGLCVSGGPPEHLCPPLSRQTCSRTASPA